MTVNFVLLLIFIGLVWKIGGEKGQLTLWALAFNLLFMFIMLILINWGFPTIVVTLIVSLGITAMNLFFINGYNTKTKIAFFSSLIVLILMIVLIFFCVLFMRLEGIATEQLMEMDMYSLNIGVSYVYLSISILIMSVVGAINDISISITAAMSELKQQLPTISSKELLTSGLTIGKDVLGSTINTLLFALFGGQLALFVWVSDLHYTFAQFLNTKILVMEWVSILLSGIGITLTIPITAYLMIKKLKTHTSES